ncbi:hypothetical protein BJ165DRAFT_1507779 [Panaeolus papilionaceus]|nr:hypothetical protein BJ165DRAFT_1507779 [Panaeolus papilionaceus]
MDPPWYPILTPHCLLVLLLGLVIGTLKAAFSYQGKTLAPIALEWIGGTILFIMLFLLGLMEDEEDLSPVLMWFFNFDLLGSLSSYLQTGITNASGMSSERRRASYAGPKRLPTISGYNILVSLVAILFGLVKATLSYLGYSTALTTVDWVFAVIITTCLFVLGLYQDRGGTVFPSLFRLDYSRPVSSITVATLVHTLFYGTLGLSALFTWTMVENIPERLKEPPITPGPDILITAFDGIHDNALKSLIILMAALTSISTVIPSLLVLLIFHDRFRYLLVPYRAIRKGTRWIASLIPPGFFSSLSAYSTPLSIKIIRHIIIHVVICLFPLWASPSDC